MSLAAMVLADRSERLVRFYDRWIGLITSGRDRRIRAVVARAVSPGDRVLDVGCGTGTLAIAVARSGARVVAVDRSPGMLSLARDKAAAAGVAVDWRQGDIVTPPIEDERFDLVTATFVLGELSRDLAVVSLRRLAEALRPGGRLIIADEVPSERPIRRVVESIIRSIVAVVSFAVLEQEAQSRRHPWWTLLREAGLEVADEPTDRAGTLVVLVARRPPELPPLQRPVVALEDALPTGIRRGFLRGAAWVDLPIAVRPGIYRVGDPDRDGPVLLTGNFLASVEAVRAGMTGRDAYLIVEDSDGWNVWCAADAGRFSAEKAAALMEIHGLDGQVDRHRVIVPRLAGRVRRRLGELTGWEVVVGPLEARDLPEFLASGLGPDMHSLARMYRLPERIRVGTLTLLQVPLFLLPLRLVSSRVRRPAWRFALVVSWLLPLAHDGLPGRTGVAKATGLGATAALVGVASRRLGPRQTAVLLATAPLVGWIYQSSSPVVFWKRVWR